VHSDEESHLLNQLIYSGEEGSLKQMKQWQISRMIQTFCVTESKFNSCNC